LGALSNATVFLNSNYCRIRLYDGHWRRRQIATATRMHYRVAAGAVEFFGIIASFGAMYFLMLKHKPEETHEKVDADGEDR